MEHVESYIYLGQAIQMNNDITMELVRRKRAAWTAFNSVKDTITNNKIDLKLRGKLFNSKILPSLLYGSETWNTTKREEDSLKSTQHTIERHICHVNKRDHIRNTDIRDRTKVADVIETMYNSKKRWAGHLARLNDNRWTVRVTNWYPRDVKRKQGRPPTRWEDPMIKVIGTLWKRKAQDRKDWYCYDLHQWRSIQGDTTGPSR